MTTQTQIKDLDLLQEIANVARSYGVKSIFSPPNSLMVEIIYEELLHGTGLSSLIEERINELAPEKTFRIKMIPSDLKLVVELL